MNPIFSRNDNFRKIAFLNWRMDSEKTQNNKNMAEGYVKSAVILIKECLSDNQDKKADIIIFPILTCLNHGIELYLKTFIDILNRLLKNDTNNVDGTNSAMNKYRCNPPLLDSIGIRGKLYVCIVSK